MALEHPEEWVRKHLVELIEIESHSCYEHEAAAYLVELAEGCGLPVWTQDVPGAGPNVLIGSRRPSLLLTAHIDTVVPTWKWSGRARVEGDRVYGLGAQDDKGCIVACLLALLIARSEGANLAELPVLVGLAVDEEQDGKGSMAMAAEVSPIYVVAVEGTDFDVCIEEAGTVEAVFELHGRTAHGAMPEHGENAIHKAVDLVQYLRDLPIMSRSHEIADPNALSVLAISGGSELFVIPEAARVHIDVRVGGLGESAGVQVALEEAAVRFGADLELVEAVEPFAVSPDSPLVKALCDSAAKVRGAQPRLIGMPAWTDAHSFAEVGCQAVVFGPGSLRQAHRVDEWISVSEIVECARIFADLFTRLARIDSARSE